MSTHRSKKPSSDVLSSHNPLSNNLSNIIILLTACINPGAVTAVQRSDPMARLSDYKQALRLWLGSTGVQTIVFCENSGFDLTEIETICQQRDSRHKTVEVLGFAGQEFDPRLGKGYGEMGIIAHAITRSRFITPTSLVVKVTGRYFMRNIDKLLAAMIVARDIDVFCDMREALSVADSRVFGGSVRFIANYLLPMQEHINDSEGIYFEHILARSTHRAMADGLRWAMLPEAPRIHGISGTNGMAWDESLLHNVRSSLSHQLRRAFVMR